MCAMVCHLAGNGVLVQVNDSARVTDPPFIGVTYACRDDPRWTNPTTGCVAPSVTGGTW